MEKSDVEHEVVRIYRYEYLRQPDAINASESPDGALPMIFGWLANRNRSGKGTLSTH